MNIIFARDISQAVTPTVPLHRTAERNGWPRIHRGAYLDLQGAKPDALDSETWHAAKVIGVSATTPVSVISGLSAAVMHDLPLLRNRITNRVHVTRPTKSKKNTWVETHQATLDEDEVVEVAGIRCTSILRTIRDLAGQVHLLDLLAVADAARARGFDLEPLKNVHRFGRKLRWVVEHASDRSESFAETWSRYHFICARAEIPMLQPSVISNDGRFLGRADFGTQFGLLGECDGRVKYNKFLKPGETAADAVMSEKRRENSLRAVNFEVTRWGWELLRDPKTFMSRWDAAKERAKLLPAPTATLDLRPLAIPTSRDWTKVFDWNRNSEA